MAVNRDVVAKWVPALTPDIVAQKVIWELNGAVVSERLIGARISCRSFARDVPAMRLQEGDTITITVYSVDEFGNSTPVTDSSSFPITAPDAPTNLVLTQKVRYRRIP